MSVLSGMITAETHCAETAPEEGHLKATCKVAGVQRTTEVPCKTDRLMLDEKVKTYCRCLLKKLAEILIIGIGEIDVLLALVGVWLVVVVFGGMAQGELLVHDAQVDEHGVQSRV